jgi:hypothetical protein
MLFNSTIFRFRNFKISPPSKASSHKGIFTEIPEIEKGKLRLAIFCC